MPTRNFTKAEILNMDLKPIHSEPWQYGIRQTCIFMYEGAHWEFTANHSKYGLQIDGSVSCVQVHQVQRVVNVWEPVSAQPALCRANDPDVHGGKHLDPFDQGEC